MTNPWPVRVLVGLAIAALAGWIAYKTSWVEIEVHVPPTGEAARPYFSLRQVATAVGTRIVERTELEPIPPKDDTLLLETRFWDLFPERDDALRRWVEGGGHLVVLQSEIPEHHLQWIPPTYTHQSPVKARRADRPASAVPSSDNDNDNDTDNDNDDRPAKNTAPPGLQPLFNREKEPVCETLVEPAGSRASFEPGRRYRRCLRPSARLGCVDRTLRRHPLATPFWELGNDDRVFAMSVAVGRGSVTSVAECLPLNNEAVLLGDHALIDAAVLRFAPGATVWIVDDEAGDPLPLWLWHNARAPLLLTLAAIALALWRLMVRFGPREALPARARRSMGEQVRGTGQFIADTDPQALHAATRKAFDDAARMRLEDYDDLDDEARAATVAALAAPVQPIDAVALVAALSSIPRATPAQWLAAIDTLEQARRALLRATAGPASSAASSRP